MKSEWYREDIQETEKKLETNVKSGLSEAEIKERQKEHGFNELKEAKKKSIILKFLEQFKDFMIIVLIIAAIVSGVINKINNEGMTDTIIILVVIIANAIIGSGELLKVDGGNPGKLKDMVTSPKGTTIAGVKALEEYGVRAAFMQAVIDSVNRSRNM